MKKINIFFYTILLMVSEAVAQTPTFSPTPRNTPTNRIGVMAVTTPGGGSRICAGSANALAQWTSYGAVTNSSVTMNGNDLHLPSTGSLYAGDYAIASIFYGGPSPLWVQLGNPNQTLQTVSYLSMTTPNTPTAKGGGIVSTGYLDIDVDGGVVFSVIPISYGGGLTGAGLGWKTVDHDDKTKRFVTCRAYASSSFTDESIGLNLFNSAGAYFNGGKIDRDAMAVTTITSSCAAPVSMKVIVFDNASAGAITLQSATGSGEYKYYKCVGAGSVTIEGSSSDTIDGSANIVISQWEKMLLLDYESGKWIIL